MLPEQVNKNLIWDYDWKESEYGNEEFEKWYVQRVLTRGMQADIDKIGIEKIIEWVDEIPLPRFLRDFWNGYLRDKFGFCSA